MKTVHLTHADIKTVWAYYCFTCGKLVVEGTKHVCPIVIDVTWRDAPELLPEGEKKMTYEIKDIRTQSYQQRLKISRREVIVGGKVKKEIYTGGIDIGTHVYSIAWLCDGYEIWHVPSFKYFGGIGSQHVAPSRYYLVHVLPDDEGKEYADLLFEVEPGAQWRKAIQELKELAKNE